MLILHRREGESIVCMLGEDRRAEIIVQKIGKNRVVVAIKTDSGVKVMREELIREEERPSSDGVSRGD